MSLKNGFNNLVLLGIIYNFTTKLTIYIINNLISYELIYKLIQFNLQSIYKCI